MGKQRQIVTGKWGVNQRIKWWAARALDRMFPDICWANIAMWALRNEPWWCLFLMRDEEGTGFFESGGCKVDCERSGQCWCMKRSKPTERTP